MRATEGAPQADAPAESEERYRRLVEGSPDAIVVHRQGVLLYVNPAAARLVGAVAPEELIGRSVMEFVHPEDRELAVGRVAQAALEPGPTESPIGRIVRLDDQVIEAEMLSIPTLYRGELAAHIVIRDVTARKRAERALRFLSEASTALGSSLDYAATLETVAHLVVPELADWCQIYLLDEHGRLARAAVAHADPAQEARLRELLDRFPIPLDSQAPVAVALRTGQPSLASVMTPVMIEQIAQSAEHLDVLRSLGPASSVVAPLVARGRALGAITLVSADPRRRYGPEDLALAEELARRAGQAVDNARLYGEAQEAIRIRDEFLSIASHELRTPITAIKAQSQLALRRLHSGPFDQARLGESIQRVVERTDRLADLIDDLLDVARVRTGGLSLVPDPVDLFELATATTALLREQIGEKYDLSLVPPPDDCTVLADSDRIEQVLGNLIENAVKYSPEGGPIRVTLAPEPDGVQVAVSDRGIGLPPGAEATIFEPFGRAPNATSRQAPGMGLGLYICREIVALHGGWIRAESDGEGRGATVTFWLPRGAPGD